MIPTLGTFGEEMALDIRQGATFGPHRFTMQDGEGTPVDLTGCVISGAIRKSPSSVEFVALDVVITNASRGEYQLGLSAAVTAAIVGGERAISLESRYVWDLELVDALGRVLPLYYGKAIVLRGITP